MPRYRALVYRTDYTSKQVEVDAKDADEAREKARDAAGDIDFGTGPEPEYEVEDVEEIKEDAKK